MIVWCRWCWASFDSLDDCEVHQYGRDGCELAPLDLEMRPPADSEVWPLKIRRHS